MASISAIREGLKTRLDTVTGLRAHSWVVGDIIPPAAVIIPGNPSSKSTMVVNYDATMGRGSDDFLFTIVLMVSNKVERVAQDALDDFLDGSGASSIRAAIAADGTLGGVAHFTNVTGVRDYGLVTYGGQTYVGAELIVEVCA